MAIGDFGESKVTIKKPELLDAVRKNRDTHQSEYEVASTGYRSAAIVSLTAMLRDAESGGAIRKALDLVEPVSHTKDYDRVIRMLEMSTADEVTITETQFSQFVLDEWSWTAAFKASSARYGR